MILYTSFTSTERVLAVMMLTDRISPVSYTHLDVYKRQLIFPIVMLVGLFLAFDGRLTMGTVSTAASMANFVITPCHQIAQCGAKVR